MHQIRTVYLHRRGAPPALLPPPAVHPHAGQIVANDPVASRQRREYFTTRSTWRQGATSPPAAGANSAPRLFGAYSATGWQLKQVALVRGPSPSSKRRCSAGVTFAIMKEEISSSKSRASSYGLSFGSAYRPSVGMA